MGVQIDQARGNDQPGNVTFLWAGHAIVGDDKYGDFDLNKRLQKQGMKRMFLHAWRLQFNHHASGERVQLIAELPPELADFVPAA